MTPSLKDQLATLDGALCKVQGDILLNAMDSLIACLDADVRGENCIGELTLIQAQILDALDAVKEARAVARKLLYTDEELAAIVAANRVKYKWVGDAGHQRLELVKEN